MPFTRPLYILTAIFCAVLAVSGCGLDDKLIENKNGAWSNKEEPPAEVLEKELKNEKKAEDGLTVQDSGLAKTSELKCIGKNFGADLSKLGYQVVIAIDKSRGGQTMAVYYQGQQTYVWPVSTGLEHPKENKLGGTSQMHTPTGFFTPNQGRLYENYFSRTWKADMPFAIFFNGGIAIHATYQSNYQYLGTRASGGCIRLERENAETLFELVKNEMGMGQVAEIGRDGCVQKNAKGEIKYKKGYRTLIVVHE